MPPASGVLAVEGAKCHHRRADDRCQKPAANSATFAVTCSARSARASGARRPPAATGQAVPARQVYWAARRANSRQRRGCEMAAKERFTKASEAARAAQRNRYVQRLLEDEDLRGTLITAWGAARSAYGRMSNGKPAAQALFDDR